MKSILQFLPKNMKIPDITMYRLSDLSFDTIKSYLDNLPVTSKILGMEHEITTEDGLISRFFIESHKTELPLTQIPSPLPPFNLIPSYYSIRPIKPSIFPFQVLETGLQWEVLSPILDKNEIVFIQGIIIKKTYPVLQDSLWTQYEDYVNGVELPTDNKIIRNLQNQILEFLKKVEGGYRRHDRIPETERKLKEDIFSFELRFYIDADIDKQMKIVSTIKDILNKHRLANGWTVIKEADIQTISEHMQYRRPSMISNNCYLSPSELSCFLMTSNTIKEITIEETLTVNEVTQNQIEIEVDVLDQESLGGIFSFMPKGKKVNHDIDVFFAEKLNAALKKLGLIDKDRVVIQQIQHGSTTQQITFTLPKGLKLTSLKRAASDLQTELAVTNISITQGEHAGTALISIPQEEREAVFIRDCVESEEFVEFAKTAELPLIIGLGESGNVVFVDLVQIKHLLVVGSTGSGKSVFIYGLLTILMALKSPSDLQLVMIDPKMVELQAFASYPHVVDVYTDMNEAEGVLCYLCDLMDERYEKMKQQNCRNIQQYNRKFPNAKMSYMVLVIDELADLIMTHPDTENYIVRLAQKARAAGIHLLIGTQKPIREVVTSLIKTNIYSRIAFACDSGISYRVALDEKPPFNLLGKGDGCYRFEGIQGLHRFQSGLLATTEEEQDKIIEKLSKVWKLGDKTNKRPIDIGLAQRKKDERELNEFKALMLETGETRITELQKILNVRNEKVKTLMNSLINEGWIKQHKSRAKGYELLLNEDDRRKELERLRGKL